MPGTARRLPSSWKKLFQMARSRRGIHVLMIVSSMSEMMPKSSSGSMIRTGISAPEPLPAARCIVCQPGASSESTIVST